MAALAGYLPIKRVTRKDLPQASQKDRERPETSIFLRNSNILGVHRELFVRTGV
jgi:hypothetical protein